MHTCDISRFGREIPIFCRFSSSPDRVLRYIPILRNSYFFPPSDHTEINCVKRVHNLLSQTSNGKLSVTPLTLPINYILRIGFSLVVFTTSLLIVMQDERISQECKQPEIFDRRENFFVVNTK